MGLISPLTTHHLTGILQLAHLKVVSAETPDDSTCFLCRLALSTVCIGTSVILLSPTPSYLAGLATGLRVTAPKGWLTEWT